MRKARRKQSQDLGTRINEAIRAREVRVIDPEEGNLGVMSRDEAISRARDKGLDLIEISGDVSPAIVKIMDYGKYQYEHKRKQRDIRAKAKEARVEVKEVQIKTGTGDHDVAMKARRASEWLRDGQRVKVELFLRGRSKYMEKDFLEGRIQSLLQKITTPFKIVEAIKKVPKGLATIIELDKQAWKKQEHTQQETHDTSEVTETEEEESDSE
ncbi:translation initiation factor IF-3 [Candidatus Nomurabacteria bacterium]|nr:translation initiation factor IF-3 [Candidatus Nomurabacteria bacterium]